MTPMMDGQPPNFMTHQMPETPASHAVDIEGLRRQSSHVASPQTHSIAGSPQVESMELPSDRAAAPIKQLSELDLELSKLIPKGGQQQQQQQAGGVAQPATSQQQGQVKLYSEVVRQQTISVTANEPQNVCITTSTDEVTSTRINDEGSGNNNVLTAQPPLVRKVSRFQVSTVVEQQQIQQLQQQKNPVEEKTVLITPNSATSTSTVTVQQMPETNIIYQQHMGQGTVEDYNVSG